MMGCVKLVDGKMSVKGCCEVCPRDITEINSFTIETTFEVTDTRDGCALSYTQTQSKTWTRENRYDSGGGFIGPPSADNKFQVFKDTTDGCCNTQFAVGLGPDNFFGFPLTDLSTYGSCDRGNPECGTDEIIGVNPDSGGNGFSMVSNAGDCSIEDNFVLSAGSHLSVACVCSGNSSVCGGIEVTVQEDPIPGVSSPTLAGLIGTYTVEDTLSGTGYSIHIKTVVTIA